METCGKNFRGFDSGVLKQLPKIVRLRFPAIVRNKTAIDLPFASLLTRQVVKKQSFRDIQKMYTEINHAAYYRTVEVYLLAEEHRRSRPFAPAQVFEMFGEYRCRNGWNGMIPSRQFLSTLYMELADVSYAAKNQLMQSITGRILCGDHTFKIAKIPTLGYQRVFEAMYTVMNEYGQILGFWMVQSKSMNDLKDEFDAVSLLLPLS